MRKVLCGGMAGMMLWGAAMAAAQGSPPAGPAMRTYAGFRLGGGFAESRDFGTGGSFETDPKVADGYYIGPVTSYQRRELPGTLYENPDHDVAVDQFISGIRAAYGRGQFESGLLIPYIRNEIHGRDDKNGFGDLQFYGKLVPIQLDGFDVAGGMTMILPSGSKSDHLGYGEVGFLPFASAAFHVPGNPLELRGMFGYRFFTDDHTGHRACSNPPCASIGRVPPDSMVYRAGALLSFGDGFGVKVDFSGEKIDINGPSDPMSIEPGLDIRFPAKAVDVVIQPTGMVGLNGEAASWGIGIGFAVTGSYSQAKARKAQPF